MLDQTFSDIHISTHSVADHDSKYWNWGHGHDCAEYHEKISIILFRITCIRLDHENDRDCHNELDNATHSKAVGIDCVKVGIANLNNKKNRGCENEIYFPPLTSSLSNEFQIPMKQAENIPEMAQTE